MMNKTLRALIVEDSDHDARLLLNELQKGCYETLYERVETYEAMVNALERQEWDLVIADYVMPRFSGLDALKLVHDRGLDLPFIIVSGKIGEDVAVEAMKAGAHDYLLKDHLTRLNLAIERELREAVMRCERKQAEQALREAQLQLFQAQKMEAFGQIAAGMAHEINNRLTAILGHLDICLSDVRKKSALHQTLLTFQKNVKSIGKLSNKLLLFGQKEEQFRAPININHNLREIRGMLKRRLIDCGISLELCLSRNPWKVYADSANIEQVVVNLVLTLAMPCPKVV